jgi:hypothetical protein
MYAVAVSGRNNNKNRLLNNSNLLKRNPTAV